MPELPEVESVVRSLAPRLVGRRVLEARTSASRVFRNQELAVAAALQDERVLGVARYGKNILLQLERARLRIHLGMTGKLLFDAAQATHPRATLLLDEGVLVFDDIRQFGRFELLPLEGKALALGPDPLELSEASFLAALRARRGAIKPLLLNQQFLRGMGNIYTDEALFAARLHPLTPAYLVSPRKARALHQAMQALLREAIAAGGSSISDYVDAEGARGLFQNRHQVYGRDGEPCPRCAATIQRMVVTQRGTHYCPRCQRALRG